mmetsp:Transcript_31588/g.57397  ORF Transcript_31588/g.57397 Transcript_31588/m.57397 type:complete len:94 (-) Transcript_31588:703-984(-)
MKLQRKTSPYRGRGGLEDPSADAASSSTLAAIGVGPSEGLKGWEKVLDAEREVWGTGEVAMGSGGERELEWREQMAVGMEREGGDEEAREEGT